MSRSGQRWRRQQRQTPPPESTAADRSEQIEYLLAFLQALRRIAEVADNSLDRILHAEEVGEGGIDLDGPVRVDAAEPFIGTRIYEGRLSDRLDHPFLGCGIHAFVITTCKEILLETDLLLRSTRVNL